MELIYRHQKYFSPEAERFRQFAYEYGAAVMPLAAAPNVPLKRKVRR